MNIMDLPIDHPARNTPLKEVNVECRNIHCNTWDSVKTYRIGVNTFNELSGPWLDCFEWRLIE